MLSSSFVSEGRWGAESVALKLLVIGANGANAEELKTVVLATVGGAAEIVTATLDNYKQIRDADLNVCLVNRQNEVESVFGQGKVVGIELVPPTDYFIKISQIPAGETVLLFNNSSAGTKVLMEYLQRYGLMHVQYETVPYDEWSPQQVAEKIAGARYITGGVAYVGPGRPLQEKFGAALSPDTKIIASPPRIASSASISQLAHVFSTIYHKKSLDELAKVAEYLKAKLTELSALSMKVANSASQCIGKTRNLVEAAEVRIVYISIAEVVEVGGESCGVLVLEHAAESDLGLGRVLHLLPINLLARLVDLAYPVKHALQTEARHSSCRANCAH